MENYVRDLAELSLRTRRETLLKRKKPALSALDKVDYKTIGILLDYYIEGRECSVFCIDEGKYMVIVIERGEKRYYLRFHLMNNILKLYIKENRAEEFSFSKPEGIALRAKVRRAISRYFQEKKRA